MAKPGIKEFHSFISGPLRKELLDRYENLRILSEGDLQSHVWQLLSDYVKKAESKKGLLKVFNKLYIREMGMFPDIVIFRGNKPWIFIELKEGKRLKERTAKGVFDKLLKIKKNISIKRGYLLYVCRYGEKKIIGKKGPGARYFYEIPITLESNWTKKRIQEWEKKFKGWAKYTKRSTS